MIDTSKPFWERRPCKEVAYYGLPQGKTSHCVYASIGGAINNILRKVVWPDAESLAKLCKGTATFESVLPVAVRDVTNEIDSQIRRDKLTGASPSEYLKVLTTCVASGGLAIVSLEIFDDPNSNKGVGCWHMLTLVAKYNESFQVWDTRPAWGFVTDAELLSKMPCYGFECERLDGSKFTVDTAWLGLHDTHDCLLLSRR